VARLMDRLSEEAQVVFSFDSPQSSVLSLVTLSLHASRINRSRLLFFRMRLRPRFASFVHFPCLSYCALASVIGSTMQRIPHRSSLRSVYHHYPSNILVFTSRQNTHDLMSPRIRLAWNHVIPTLTVLTLTYMQ